MAKFLSEGIEMETEKCSYLYKVISAHWEKKKNRQGILGLFFIVVFTGYFFGLFYFNTSIVSP